MHGCGITVAMHHTLCTCMCTIRYPLPIQLQGDSGPDGPPGPPGTPGPDSKDPVFYSSERDDLADITVSMGKRCMMGLIIDSN